MRGTTAQDILTFVWVIAFIAGMVLAPRGSIACDKKGHDCRGRLRQASLADLPFRVAEYKGFFSNERVNPELVWEGDANVRMSELVSGASLFAVVSSAEFIQLATKVDQLRIISTLQTRSADFIAGAKGQDFKAFKGKIVAVPSPESEQALYARLAFAKTGLGPGDYSLKFFPAVNERLAAVTAGHVQAATVAPSGAFELRKQGYPVLPLADYGLTIADTVIIGRASQLRDEGKGIVGLLRALGAAIDFVQVREYREQVVSVLEKDYKIPRATAEFIYDTLISKYRIYALEVPSQASDILRMTNDWLIPAKVMLKADYFEGRYLREALGGR